MHRGAKRLELVEARRLGPLFRIDGRHVQSGDNLDRPVIRTGKADPRAESIHISGQVIPVPSDTGANSAPRAPKQRCEHEVVAAQPGGLRASRRAIRKESRRRRFVPGLPTPPGRTAVLAKTSLPRLRGGCRCRPCRRVSNSETRNSRNLTTNQRQNRRGVHRLAP